MLFCVCKAQLLLEFYKLVTVCWFSIQILTQINRVNLLLLFKKRVKEDMCIKKKEYQKIKPHFRTASGKAKGHPTRIHGEDRDNYYYIQLTHSPTTHKVKNIPLKKNPNPKDDSKSYMRPDPYKQDKKKFGKKKEGWRLSLYDWWQTRKIRKKKHK